MSISKELATLDDKTLAAPSRKLFVDKIIGMLRLTGSTSEETMLAAPEATWLKMKRSRSFKHSAQNHHNFLSAAVAAFRHVPGLRDKHPDAAEKWIEMQRVNSQVLKDRYLDNEPSLRQQASLVPYKTILKARDALPSGHLTKLLLLFYTAIPPARGGDYHALRIYEGDSDDTDNHIILPAKGKCQLVLQKFKTSKKYGVITHVLPKEFCQEIRASLRMHPREYVFGPYSRAAFSAWANRALKKQFKKALTTTMLRHLYISQLDFNNLTLRQLEAVSKKMGHKVGTQAKYKWVKQHGGDGDDEDET